LKVIKENNNNGLNTEYSKATWFVTRVNYDSSNISPDNTRIVMIYRQSKLWVQKYTTRVNNKSSIYHNSKSKRGMVSRVQSLRFIDSHIWSTKSPTSSFWKKHTKKLSNMTHCGRLFSKEGGPEYLIKKATNESKWL